MKRQEMRAWVRDLGEHYGWRLLPDEREVLGMQRGVGFSFKEWDDVVWVLAFAPGANVGEEVLKGFEGFTHWQEAGLPADCLQGRTTEDCSCTLALDGTELEAVGHDLFLRIPDLLAADLLTHGGQENTRCDRCNEVPATDVLQMDYKLACVCLGCRQALEIQRHGERVALNQPVLWDKVLWRWFAIAFVGALTWSIAVTLIIQNRLPLIWEMLPFVWGIAASAWVLRTGTGYHWLLAAGTCVAVVAGILGADLWVFRQELAQLEPDVGLVDVLLTFLGAGVRPPELIHAVAANVGALAWMLHHRPKTTMRVR